MERYKRGDIVLLPYPFILSGSVKQKLRPGLIFSDTRLKKRFSDLVVLPLSSRVEKSLFKTEVLIDEKDDDFADTGLVTSSVVKCEILMTFPKKFIIKKIGFLPHRLMQKVEDAVRLNLGMVIMG